MKNRINRVVVCSLAAAGLLVAATTVQAYDKLSPITVNFYYNPNYMSLAFFSAFQNAQKIAYTTQCQSTGRSDPNIASMCSVTVTPTNVSTTVAISAGHNGSNNCQLTLTINRKNGKLNRTPSHSCNGSYGVNAVGYGTHVAGVNLYSTM